MRSLLLTLSRCTFIAAVLYVLPVASATAQQVWIPSNALLDHDDVRRVFAEGSRLEKEQKWLDALSVYEEAARQYPDHKQLQERLDVAKRRFSVARRYSDSSFISSVQSLSMQQALNLYNEVLGKIQLHYVGQATWSGLIEHGTRNLVVALSSAEFRRANGIHVSEQRIEAFVKDVRRRLAEREERSRLDAEISATLVSEIARRELGAREAAIILEYACGAANSLDDYSAFLTPDQYTDVMSQIEGNFVGLGIELKADNGALLIVNVIAGGPAAAGGMREGDRIVEIDGQATKPLSTDAAADLLRGPEGSAVNLVVQRNASGNLERLRLTRQRVEVPSIEDAKILDSQFGIGYFKLTSFQKTTSDELDKALWALHDRGMRIVIMDLRGNPGGLLPASVKVADRFLSQGVIVSTRGRNVRENYDYQAHLSGTWRVPLIVLIDEDSASASEIFAGAIRDHKRGVVIGQRSYGKGSVQGIFPLANSNAGIRLTTAKFYSPSGRAISKNGVQPDVRVQVAAKPNLIERNSPSQVDGVLDHALQYARNQVAQR